MTIRSQPVASRQGTGAGQRASFEVAQPNPAPSRTGPMARPPREPLDDGARRLLQTPDVQALLVITSAQFPHVINRISAAWGDADVLLHLLDELLLDDRAKRQGFPLDVALELSNLRTHYELRVAPILRGASTSRRTKTPRPGTDRAPTRSEGGFAGLGALLRKLLGRRA